MIVATPDARVIDQKTGSLTIDPVQEGSSGYIELVGGNEKKTIPSLSKTTPFKATLRANERYHFHLELAGFVPYDDT